MLGRCVGAWLRHMLPVPRRKGRGQEPRSPDGCLRGGRSQWRNRLPREEAPGSGAKIAGGGERGNKSEGFLKEVHRRHPPLGRRGQKRRLDRQRPRDEPFVGAVVPLAQRHLPPRDDFDAARSSGVLPLRGRARAGGSRRLVRPRSRQRPSLAEALEKHREGRAAPHTDQDRPPEARGRQGPGDPLARISARSGLRLSARHFAACQYLLAERSRP
jgi:hypothetical protein